MARTAAACLLDIAIVIANPIVTDTLALCLCKATFGNSQLIAVDTSGTPFQAPWIRDPLEVWDAGVVAHVLRTIAKVAIGRIATFAKAARIPAKPVHAVQNALVLWTSTDVAIFIPHLTRAAVTVAPKASPKTALLLAAPVLITTFVTPNAGVAHTALTTTETFRLAYVLIAH